MTPYLITAPSLPVVGLSDLKSHLRVDHSADDALILGLEAQAVAHLDGWTGILGRCIMPQTWAVDLTAGRHVLPMPDVTAASLDGDPLTVTPGPCGPMVTIEEDGAVHFTCAMPARLLPAAQGAVKLAVAEWYERREAGSADFGPAYGALVGTIRWLRA